jgi:hypothetical protein
MTRMPRPQTCSAGEPAASSTQSCLQQGGRGSASARREIWKRSQHGLSPAAETVFAGAGSWHRRPDSTISPPALHEPQDLHSHHERRHALCLVGDLGLAPRARPMYGRNAWDRNDFLIETTCSFVFLAPLRWEARSPSHRATLRKHTRTAEKPQHLDSCPLATPASSSGS